MVSQVVFCLWKPEEALKVLYKSALWFYAYSMCQKEIPCKSPDDFAALSDYIASIRKMRGYSIRNVIDLVNAAIANKTLQSHCSLSRGYLSNLEAGKYTNPSPFKLQALAHVYTIPYESLLRKAGYWENACDKVQQDATFTLMLKEVQRMTPEEVHSLFEFIDFVKSKRTLCREKHR